MTIDFAPFDGDGRTKITPTSEIRNLRPKCVPIAVTRGTARRMIEAFVETRKSTHSVLGSTLWVIEVWAYAQKREIKVIKHPLGGWYVQLLDEDTE